MGKKKRPNGDHHAGDTTPPQTPDPITGDASHPIPKKTKKRKNREEKLKSKPSIPTVSIAVPGSIIDNAQSLELATRLAGQIARAATIFRIDEVVVFENIGSSVEESSSPATESSDDNESGAAFLIKILKYLETPQYLRKILFPKQNSLRYAGVLPPLDAPHHLRKHEWTPYRDGITLKERAPNSTGTLVDVGLSKNVVIDQVLEPGQRVTVAMGANRSLDPAVLHQIVSPLTPRDEGGMYWGYRVRHASSLSSVCEECPYEGGYDYLIGTSEHGSTVKSSELLLPTFSIWRPSWLGREHRGGQNFEGKGCEGSLQLIFECVSESREPNNQNRGSNLCISPVFSRTYLPRS